MLSFNMQLNSSGYKYPDKASSVSSGYIHSEPSLGKIQGSNSVTILVLNTFFGCLGKLKLKRSSSLVSFSVKLSHIKWKVKLIAKR